jgi:hypothetical protein
MLAFAPITPDKSIHVHHAPQVFRSFNNLPRVRPASLSWEFPGFAGGGCSLRGSFDQGVNFPVSTLTEALGKSTVWPSFHKIWDVFAGPAGSA